MKTTDPPRLAVILLNRFVPDEALAGDVLEEFALTGSHVRLWRQVVGAGVATLFRAPRDPRSLKLLEIDSTLGNIQPVRGRDRLSRSVNLAASPRGAAVGGLGMVALAVLVTFVLPQGWWLLLFGLAGGILLGGVMVAFRRWRSSTRCASPFPATTSSV